MILPGRNGRFRNEYRRKLRGRLTPGVEGLEARALLSLAIQEFPITGASSQPNRPWLMTTGADGNVWFTENSGQIGRIAPNGTITQFSVPTSNSGPYGITAAPDGTLWFTEIVTDKFGKLDPATGQVTEYSLNVQPIAIAAGPDGNLWFSAEQFGSTATSATGAGTAPQGYVGRITPAGVVSLFPLPSGQQLAPSSLTAGPDGNVWFTENDANAGPADAAIGRITPDGQITEFPLPAEAGAGKAAGTIVAGPDGNLWFTESALTVPSFDTSGAIGQITPSGQITEFAVPSVAGDPISHPSGLTVGTDGQLWFTLGATGALGSITTNGVVNEFPPSTSTPANPTETGNPWGPITTGADGSFWVADSGNDAIARVSLNAAPTAVAPPTAPVVSPTAAPAHGVVLTHGASGSPEAVRLRSHTATIRKNALLGRHTAAVHPAKHAGPVHTVHIRSGSHRQPRRG